MKLSRFGVISTGLANLCSLPASPVMKGLYATVLLVSFAGAQGNSGLINDVIPDYSNQTLTIVGTNFSTTSNTVTLGSTTLRVVAKGATSSTRIIAALPAGSTFATSFSPGTYLLTVVSGGLPLTFQVTLGTAGPQGPQGPQGPAGLVNVYIARQVDGEVGVNSAGATRLATLNLPSGSYSLDGRVRLQLDGVATANHVTFAACDLVGSGTTIDHVESLLAEITDSNLTNATDPVGQVVSLTGTVYLTSTGPITLQCTLLGGTLDNASARYGVLKATQVAQINPQ